MVFPGMPEPDPVQPPKMTFVKPDHVAGAKRRKPVSVKRVRSAKAARRKALEHQFAAPVANPVPVPEVPEVKPLGRVQSYLQKGAPEPMDGVEQPVVRKEEKDWPLDFCPLCGGEAAFEEMGTLYPKWSVVCQKCFCSTQSYGSKYWAAWRWNTRRPHLSTLEMPPPDADTPPNDYDEDVEDVESVQPQKPVSVEPECSDEPLVFDPPPPEQEKPADDKPPDFMPVMTALPPVPDTQKEPKPRKKRRKPVDPNQMVFDFMEAANG